MNPDFLLSIFLRGGADGLTFCCPYDDINYQQGRDLQRIFPPGSGNPGKEAVPLTPQMGNVPAFGMAPALAPLLGPFQSGKLCFVHATGSMDPTRSHFDQEVLMQTGITATSSTQETTGWIARHLLSSTPVGDGSLRGLAILDHMPPAVVGAPAFAPTPDPTSFGFPGDPTTGAARRSALDDMYALSGGPLLNPFNNTLSTVDKLTALDWEGYLPGNGAVYPESKLGRACLHAAQIAKEVPDIEVVHTSRGGWDLHSSASVFHGPMEGGMSDLANSLQAFLLDMDAHARKVIVIVMTEFGRSLDENSSHGTDHGRGGVAIVAGDHVNGGQVITDWPGLDAANLDGGDLAVTIDIRDLMSEIIVERLMNPNLGAVFTDTNYTYTERGITN